jgi:hypothetical protein
MQKWTDDSGSKNRCKHTKSQAPPRLLQQLLIGAWSACVGGGVGAQDAVGTAAHDSTHSHLLQYAESHALMIVEG